MKMLCVKKVIGLTRISSPDHARLAEAMGMTLTRHTGGRKGWYDHPTRTISTRRGMNIAQYRSTLAHELGHAHYGDTPTGNGHYDQRQENRVWAYAANLRISPVDFAAAALWLNDHLPAIADNLEVTQYLLKFWINQYEKLAA